MWTGIACRSRDISNNTGYSTLSHSGWEWGCVRDWGRRKRGQGAQRCQSLITTIYSKHLNKELLPFHFNQSIHTLLTKTHRRVHICLHTRCRRWREWIRSFRESRTCWLSLLLYWPQFSFYLFISLFSVFLGICPSHFKLFFRFWNSSINYVPASVYIICLLAFAAMCGQILMNGCINGLRLDVNMYMYIQAWKHA